MTALQEQAGVLAALGSALAEQVETVADTFEAIQLDGADVYAGEENFGYENHEEAAHEGPAE